MTPSSAEKQSRRCSQYFYSWDGRDFRVCVGFHGWYFLLTLPRWTFWFLVPSALVSYGLGLVFDNFDSQRTCFLYSFKELSHL